MEMMSTDRVTSGKGANLVSNAQWNFIAFSINVLINFVTIPIAITFLGLNQFGASGLVIAIYAPFLLLGTVIGQIVVRELSQDVSVKDDRSKAELYSAGLCVCVAGCILVVSVLTVAGGSIIHLVVKNVGVVGIDWKTGFLIAGIGWAAQQGCLVLQAAVVSTQKYGSLAIASISTVIVSAATLVVCVLLLPTFLGFLIGTSIGFMLSLIIWTFLVRRLLPQLFPLPSFGLQHLRHIFKIGKWQGGAHFVGAIGIQADRYTLGAMAPIAVVGQYNVAMRLQEVIHMGLLKITEVVWPHFAVTSNDPIEQRAPFFLQVSWIMCLIGLTTLAPLIPLSNELITIWVGAESADGGGQILRTLAAAGIVGSCVNVYFYFALGTGQTIRISGLSIAHALLTIILTIIFIGMFGPLAAGLGTLVAGVFRLAITLYFTGQYFHGAISLRSLLLSTLLPLAAGFALAWYWTYAAWFQPDGWLTLLIDYTTIACSIFLGGVFATSFSKDGRQLISDVFLSLQGHFKQGKTCVE